MLMWKHVTERKINRPKAKPNMAGRIRVRAKQDAFDVKVNFSVHLLNLCHPAFKSLCRRWWPELFSF
jgi:hypothetical protein